MRIHWSIGLGIIVLLLASIGFGITTQDAEEEFTVGATEEVEEEIVVVEKTVYEVPDTPEEYIKWKFGEEDGERGIKMLKECENKQFDPEAINWNGNGTWDFGLWQINQIHGHSKEVLSDWQINTDIAYEIFVEAGRSFSPWTCAEVAGDKPFWK